MKLDVRFSENNMSLDVALPNEPKAFDPDMGEVMVVHDGQNGATFYPAVSEDGTISWTNDRGLDNPPPVNIRGKDGYTPVKGVDYFDGKDGVNGRDGQDGYTPVKGVDYFDGRNGVDGKDGYTPIKGVDYFDGKNGNDGKDGYTPVKGKDYFDGKDGSAGKDGVAGYTPIKGVDYFDGKDGKDGSAGKDGSDGYSPVRGVDYWTDADKAAMVSDVIAALPKYNGEVVAV